MTNLLCTLTVALVTNWTGINNSTNEIGYIVTNTTAHVVFEGKTNSVPVKEEVGRLLLLRPSYMPTAITNFYWWNGQGIRGEQAPVYITNNPVILNAGETKL